LVRELAGDGHVPPLAALSGYMEKFGSFTDVSCLVGALASSQSGGLLSLSLGGEDTMGVARAIVRLAKGRLPELLATEMPSRLRAQVIEHCSSAEFRRLSGGTIDTLLHDQSDEVRRAAVLRLLDTRSKKIVASVLEDYVGRQSYFYNVVHWLDFGASMSVETVRDSIPRARR
jgi:hypothetical protein